MEPNQPEQRNLAEPTEVASFLKIPVGTLAQWRYRSVGPPSVRVGRHTRYRWADVERWLNAQARKGAA